MSDQFMSVLESTSSRRIEGWWVSPLDVLLNKSTPFGDDRLYNEIPFLPLVLAFGRLGKGEDLTVYTSACNQHGRFLSVVWRKLLTIRTSPPRHPYIKVLHLRLLGWSRLCVPVSIAAPAGGWSGYVLREPR